MAEMMGYLLGGGALLAVLIVGIARLMRFGKTPEEPVLRTPSDPEPDGAVEGRDFFPEGHRILEQRHVGGVTLTLCERVRVRGVRAKGWERVVFVRPPGPLPMDDGERLGRALLEWSSESV